MDSGLDRMYQKFAIPFASTFDVSDATLLAQVNAAGHRLAACFIVIDNMVDGDLDPATGVLESTRLMLEGFQYLTSCVGDHALFWSAFFPATQRWLAAFGLERDFVSHRRSLSGLSLDEMTALAADRGSVAIGTPALLASVSRLGDADARLERVAASIHAYSVAQQLRDDVLDWRRDLAARRPNFVLAALAQNHDLDIESEPDLARAVHSENIGLDLLRDASMRTLAAGEAIADIAPGWATILSTAARALENVLTYVQRMDPPAPGPSGPRPLAIRLDRSTIGDAQVFDGLTELLRAYQRPSSLRHPMMFPADSGVSKPGIYVGDVFSRAMAINCLAAVDEGLGSLGDLIGREADILLSRRDPGAAGLWRYFPGFDDLSPDIDTFAEVGSALLASGRMTQQVREAYVATADNVLAAAKTAGGLETWIFACSEEIGDLERSAANRLWGRTQDPEVAANFLWFLLRLDPSRYHSDVCHLIDMVFNDMVTHQLRATWYTDCGYAEFVLVRLLRCGFDDHLALLERAVQRSQQLAQEGGAFTMLRDAFYLLVASMVSDDAVGSLLDIDQTAASRERLAQACLNAGTPTAEPFIHMDLSRTGILTGELVFASEIVQRAWVMRALTASPRISIDTPKQSEPTRAG